MAAIWIKWVKFTNEVEKLIEVPTELDAFLQRVSQRNSFVEAVGKHGKDGYVINTIQSKL
jgi:hypothetical protein